MRIFALLALAASLSAHAEEGDPAMPPSAATCMACHGISGVSNNDMWPNIAGQKRGYLAKALGEYRSGVRKDLMMGPMAKNLSDEDIEALAGYYAQLPAGG